MAQDAPAALAALQAATEALRQAPQPTPAQIEAWLAVCRDAMRGGLSDQALPLLEQLAARRPGDARIFTLIGHASRVEQKMERAQRAFDKACELSPEDPSVLSDLAQCEFELGRAAAALFGRAMQLSPGRLDLCRSQAAALVAEGRAPEAIARLQSLLSAHPGWIDGHKSLASFLWLEGRRDLYTDGLERACQREPQNAALWITWFQLVAQTRDWPTALAILDRAERHLGDTPGLKVSRLFVASESDDDAMSEKLLTETRQIAGDVVSLCRIRHLIRKGRPEAAEAEITPRLTGPVAPLYWPYASIVWRMQGDDRAVWLDRCDDIPKLAEADLSKDELDELAATLRGLHTARAPYPEQSVRGGTQTDRSVLLRHEPILNRTREALLSVIRDFIADLPPVDPRHPLLSAPRNHLLIEGSWSVRLEGQGYNVPHTHPRGWLSTAFYVTTPEPAEMGPAPAGHLALGAPPVELNCGLGALKSFAPRPGRLAIFPSTLWHGTVPFEAGERMVIAFDIRRPDR